MIEAIVPILFAGIASFLLGSLWYSPKVFGNAWIRFTNLSPEQTERGKRHALLTGLLGLCESILLAYVLFTIGADWHVHSLLGSLELALWSWVGFGVPLLASDILWEQKPFKLFLINAFYWFCAFVVMALILFYTSAIFAPSPYDTGSSASYALSH